MIFKKSYYNSSNLLIKEQEFFYFDNGKIEKKLMHYFESNNDSVVSFSEMKTYEHNDNGKLTTEYSYDKDLKLNQIIIYEFESDKIIKKSFYEIDDLKEKRLIRTNIFKHSTNHGLIDEFISKPDDTNKRFQTLHRCYGDGKKFEEIHYDSDGNIWGEGLHIVYDFRIDSHTADIIDIDSFYDADEYNGRRIDIKYEYNEDNNLVKLTYVESRSNFQEIVVYHQN
jgi:hypothetical protein